MAFDTEDLLALLERLFRLHLQLPILFSLTLQLC